MKIAFVEFGPGTGGSSLSLLQLLSALDRSRFEPVVLLRERHPRGDDLRGLDVRLRAVFPPSGPPTANPPGAALGGPLAQLRRTRWYREWSARRNFPRWIEKPAASLARHLRDEAPDVVYVNNGLIAGGATVAAARELGLPILCHERGFQPHYRPYRLLGMDVRRYVCISEAVERHLHAEGIDAARTRVIPNAIDGENYHPQFPADPEVSALQERGPVLVSTGRLVKWKGVDVLLRAVAELRTEYPTLQVVIAGEGEHRGELERLAGRLHIENRVRFTGFVPDIRGMVRGATILVHTAVQPEPFGRTVLEGLALGVPVVATNLGGVPEIIENGVSGILVSPGDPGILAGELRRLLADPDRQRDLAAAGRTRAAGFDHRSHAARIETVLEELRENA